MYNLKSGGYKKVIVGEIKTIITGYVENNDMERIPREYWPKRGGQCCFQRKIYNFQCFHLLRHNEGQFLNNERVGARRSPHPPADQ